MFDQIVVKGATSQILEVTLRDSTTGQGKTGVAYGSVTASYCRQGSTRQAITLASGSAGDAYSSGKWAEVDATNMKGLYQLHIPDAALATGADSVTLQLQASGVIDKVLRVLLIDANLRDSVRMGLTGLSDDVLDEAVEGSVTLRQIQRLLLATLAGKVSGGGTTSVKYRDQADTKDRITLTVDANGNRSATAFDAD